VLETIKKTILAALRAVPLTSDEVRAIVREFEAEGQMTEEQGKKLLDALLGREGDQGADAADRLAREFQRLRDSIPVVSRGEFRELVERVRRLEERMGSIPTAAQQAPEELPPSADEDAGTAGGGGNSGGGTSATGPTG
jgi:polyhydroxyalkanoate synthesis regulator phasin